MAPPKVMLSQRRQTNAALTRKGVTTRSQQSMLSNVLKQANINRDTRVKRKAEASPIKEKTTKRSALGNITNVYIFPFIIIIIIIIYASYLYHSIINIRIIFLYIL